MKKIQLFITGILLMVICTTLHSQVNIPFQSTWKYLKGKDAGNLPANWFSNEYNDNAWSEGNAPFRYTDGSGGTVLSDMKDSYSTVYLRKSFSALNLTSLTRMVFEANYDDGFVLWLNGQEIARYNAPEVLTSNGIAPEAKESGEITRFYVDISKIPLKAENNLIAVQGFNAGKSSSDFYMDFSWYAYPEIILSATTAVFFDHDAGFYTSPFDVTLTAPGGGYKIIYTIDGSSPATSKTSDTVSSPFIVHVDPDNNDGRGKTPAFIIRASLYKEGYLPSLPQAKTYIFTYKVKAQSYPGGSWPSSDVNGQRMDYNMAPDVVNDDRYSALIDDALLAIPSISLTTDMENLFDANRGIYVNANMQGKEWERECSVELINPDGSEGFQINAGVRIRGGSSRYGSNPKHSFRLFFDYDYGLPELEFPLFGTEGVSEFKDLDLRTEQNYSWSKDGGSDGARNTFVREVFTRDSQRDEGKPYTRSRYYHLYLNGMYWGLYQSEERPEASYAKSYFGDDQDDYDVVKVEPVGWPFYDVVTDGTMDSWKELYDRCGKGFASNKDYFSLLGKDEYGNNMANTRVMVDIDNLIDYMLTIFYTGNFDAPVSSWHNNDMPNNFFAICSRKNLSTGYRFIAHDSEHSLFIINNYSDGLYENRVEIPGMSCANVYSFQPQWLHYKLTANAEYRNLFRDKAFQYFREGGVFSPAKTADRFKSRADEINLAIIGESARWGDSQVSPSRTKDDDWLPEIEQMYSDYFPVRTGIVIGQMKDAGLYSDFEAPVVSRAGSPLTDQAYSITDAFDLSVDNPNTSGILYYTLDGSDPRQIGGLVSDQAIESGDHAVITIGSSTILKARIKFDNEWSPIRQVYFFATEEDYSHLKVTELAYHPQEEVQDSDTTDDKNFEFIEFKNTGSTAMNISGLRLDSAVTFTVPEYTMLPPKGFYVIASKPESFYHRYGLVASGNFKGNFSNSGEYVLLTDRNGKEILSFTYDDHLPWPEEADGSSSLVSVNINPTGDPNDYSYWTLSSTPYGSPFADDGPYASNPDPVSIDLCWSVYPNPTNEYIQVQYLGHEAEETMKVQLFTQDGRIVFSDESEHQGCTIDLKAAGLKPGVYFLKTSINGNLHVEKIIYLNL
jgi:CotH kinase protein/Lamin Tail Domain/Secretion system C-terminal sorting domain